ncbi:MAG: hypothetical protein NUV63_12770 [Gallionella sp.]|nr:hypothetical protein [Gallionella sp.]
MTYQLARAASVAFYSFLLGWTRLDLMIARSTGRNPEHIAQLCRDQSAYETEITRWELGL